MFSRISKAIKWIGEHFKGLLFLLIVALIFIPKGSTTSQIANLQEIKLFGTISDANEILKEIESAKKNPKIKGVLLNVNSGGGSVPPSIEISYAIRELAKKKPVVAYASGTMASGSYYSSIYATKIVANPGSIIGSIGVILQSANIKELLDKIGVKPQTVKQGLYKEAGTPTRKWSNAEREELEQLTKDTYELFISDVAKARGLDLNSSDKFANAHIFSPIRAKKIGLIDEIGVMSIAKKDLIELSKVKKPIWREKPKLEKFLDSFKEKSTLLIENSIFGLRSSIF
jgi:protease-4